MLLGTALMCPRSLQDTALIVFIKEQLECRHSSSRCEGHMVRRHTSSAVYHRACMLCGALCHFKEVYCVYCRLLSVHGHNVGQCAFLHNLKKKNSSWWLNHNGKTLFCIYMPWMLHNRLWCVRSHLLTTALLLTYILASVLCCWPFKK